MQNHGQECLKPADTELSMSTQIIETFYAHLEFKTKTGGWSINLPFLCSKCGICCTLDDFLTAGKLKTNPENPQAHIKAKTLYQELGKRWETNETQYDHYITHTPAHFSATMPAQSMKSARKDAASSPTPPLACRPKTAKHSVDSRSNMPR
jgi:hypothetical protein